MNVNVKYFGMIAEKTGVHSEDMEIHKETQSDELLELLKTRYPALIELPFKMAVNQEIIIQKTEIQEGVEIALLPAYAGG